MPRARKQPVRTPTGLPYGEQAQLAEAQRNNPLPRPPVAEVKQPTIPQVTQAPGLNPASSEEPPPSVNEIAKAHNFQPVGLGNPSQRPNEPVTHGIPLGAGGGPEVLGPPRAQGPDLHALVASLAAQPNAPAGVKYLAGYLASGKR